MEQPIGIKIKDLCARLLWNGTEKAVTQSAADFVMALPAVKRDLSDDEKKQIFNQVHSIQTILVDKYKKKSASKWTEFIRKYGEWYETTMKLPAKLLQEDVPPTEEQPQTAPMMDEDQPDAEIAVVSQASSNLEALSTSFGNVALLTESQDAEMDVDAHQEASEVPIPDSSTTPLATPSCSSQPWTFPWGTTVTCLSTESKRPEAIAKVPVGGGIAYRPKSHKWTKLYIKKDESTLEHVPMKYGQPPIGEGEWSITFPETPEILKKTKMRGCRPILASWKTTRGKCAKNPATQKWSQTTPEKKKEWIRKAALASPSPFSRATREKGIRNYLQRRFIFTPRDHKSLFSLALDKDDPILDQELQPLKMPIKKPVKRLSKKRPGRRPKQQKLNWKKAPMYKKRKIVLSAIQEFGQDEEHVIKMENFIMESADNYELLDVDNIIVKMRLAGLVDDNLDRILLTSKGLEELEKPLKEPVKKPRLQHLLADGEIFFEEFGGLIQEDYEKAKVEDQEDQVEIDLDTSDENQTQMNGRPISASNIKAWMGKMKGKQNHLREASAWGRKFEPYGLHLLEELIPGCKMTHHDKKLYLRHKDLTAVPDAKVWLPDETGGKYEAFVEIKSPLSAAPVSEANKEKPFETRLNNLPYMELFPDDDGSFSFRLMRESAYYAQVQAQMYASDPEAARDGKKVSYKKVDHVLFVVFVPIIDTKTNKWHGQYEMYIEKIDRDEEYINTKLIPTCRDYLKNGPSKK